MLAGAIPYTARPDADRIAIVGHSAGGWTALALPETDTRIKDVVVLAPGAASNPKPGITPATLSFNWPRRRVMDRIYFTLSTGLANLASEGRSGKSRPCFPRLDRRYRTRACSEFRSAL